MRYPEFLKNNGKIGFIAPSFGCATDVYRLTFESALNKFKSMGYDTILGPNCFKNDGIGISSLPENCAKEFMDSYKSEDSDILISCGGGELMCEILEYIDFNEIAKANPKWFLGYSDNTNLTFLLTTLCDVASIYGPNAGSFGMNPWHESIEDAYELLSGKVSTVHQYDSWELESLKDLEHPFVPYNTTEKTIIKTFPDNHDFEFSGRLIGGCLDILENLCGTEYDKVEDFCDRYSEDGIIWFLEACDLNVMSIRRALWRLEKCGWFKHVKGFVVGRPYHFDEGFLGMDQYLAVTGILNKYNVPIIMDADIGHRAPMMPLICGSMAKVGVSTGKIQITMELN